MRKLHPAHLIWIVMVLLVPTSYAIPGIPHAFYGTVTWNGAPAPDGMSVVAKIDGVEVASTSVKDGKYGYDPVFYVDDPDNDRSGKEIRFFVNGVDTGQTKYFCNGCVTELDLSASGETGESPPVSGGSGSSGGGGGGTAPSGGGGSTGGGVSTTQQETTNEEGSEETVEKVSGTCEERWICSEWSECTNGLQTRTCEDVNNCGTDLNKPLETQPCSTLKEERTPTGFQILAPVHLGLVILGVIIILLVALWKKGVLRGIIPSFKR